MRHDMPIFFPCGGVAMGISKEFDRYMAHLAEGLGHADLQLATRHAMPANNLPLVWTHAAHQP